MLATIYKEVQDMVSQIAQHRGMTYVVRISNDPVIGREPELGDGRHGEDRPLRRPEERHHQGRRLQSEHALQASRGRQAEGHGRRTGLGRPAGRELKVTPRKSRVAPGACPPVLLGLGHWWASRQCRPERPFSGSV